MRKYFVLLGWIIGASAHAGGVWVNSTLEYVQMSSASKIMYLKMSSGTCSGSGQLVLIHSTDPLFKEKVSMALAALTAGKTMQIWVNDQTCTAYDNDVGYIIHK